MDKLRATGIVIDRKSRFSNAGYRAGWLFHLVVRFETRDGRKIEFESKIGSNMSPKVGEKVIVIYDPLRPEEARLALGSAIRFSKAALIMMGAITLLFITLVSVPLLIMVLMVFLSAL